MKRLTLCLLSLAIGSPLLFAQKIEVPPYKKETLENGLTVLLMEYHKLPLIEVRLTVKGGASYDPKGSEGLASLTAGLLRKGTATKSATQISDAIDFIGGSLNASAGADYFTITSEVLKKDLEKGFELFADVVLHPAFAQDELERERSQRIATIAQSKENPSSIASICFNKTVYGAHPYGNSTIGTSESLKKITRADVQTFYKELFLPNASILTIVGDFDTGPMLDRIKNAFGNWERGTPRSMAFEKPAMHKGRKMVIVNKSDVTQTQIRIGNIGVNRKNPDFFAITVANSILGNGFTSRLTEEIRVKRSLTYGVSSQFPANLETGMYLISTFTKNQTTREVIDIALAEVKKFRDEGATAEELSKAQNYLAGGFARSLQAPEALAAQISDMEFFNQASDYLTTYIQKLKAVTLDDVKRVAQKYFLYDDLVMLVVTPAKDVQPKLESLGKVEVMDFQNVIN